MPRYRHSEVASRAETLLLVIGLRSIPSTRALGYPYFRFPHVVLLDRRNFNDESQNSVLSTISDAVLQSVMLLMQYSTIPVSGRSRSTLKKSIVAATMRQSDAI